MKNWWRWESFEEFMQDTEERGTDTLESWHGVPEDMDLEAVESMADLARQSRSMARKAGMDNLADEWEDYLFCLEDEPGLRAEVEAIEETEESLRRGEL